MNSNFWERLKILYKKEDGNIKAYKAEQPVLKSVLNEIRKELKDDYEFDEPLGRGGSGIVIRLKDKRLGLDRVLKISRPRGKELIDSAINGIEHLNEIRHENIIGIYRLGEVKISNYPCPYFVMDYIKDAQNLRKKTLSLLKEVKESSELKKVTRWVADKFSEIAEAVNFLHNNHQIIHFDIKPGNILIDTNNKPILSDLGFAKKKSNKKTPVAVGFTTFYAHPALKSEYQHMYSKDRVRKEISPRNFKYIFDIYAYGKSLLEILGLIGQKFPDIVVYDYTFVYLHLSACRMLDGMNQYPLETDRIRGNLIQPGKDPMNCKETWIELDARYFEEIKYHDFNKITQDFKKLLIGDFLIESIQELNPFYPKRVQTSHGIPAPFSKRVKYIIEHPVFSRLNYTNHLGFINCIYPTATHTRLEHSLGVFRNCCLYIQSLYNDSYNPLFKQLLNIEDIKSALLASLLHDLGQYPLAHEIGEVAKEFDHERFTLLFLDNPAKDKHGYTLQDIIEDKDWGWGVPLNMVKEILKGEKEPETLPVFPEKSLKTKILSSIIDGPIDVDKLDYLLRDSQNCYLKYGELIDVDRLIRNLTVIINKDNNAQISLSVGTYEKGQSAAESLMFARYLLYQSLYWHHTARAVRTMLTKAIESALKNKKKKGKYKTFLKEIEELIGVNNRPQNITTDDILDLISNRTDKNGVELIDMIRNRNYYKRVLTIHSYPSSDGKSLLTRFRNVFQKQDFQNILQEKIKKEFENHLTHIRSPKVSLLSPEITDKALKILSTPDKIICDCPKPSHGTKDKLRFIPEPQRLQKNYYIRASAGERVSEVWNQVYFKMMNIASKGRVFCHPDVRDTLMATIGPEGIEECLKNVIEMFET